MQHTFPRAGTGQGPDPTSLGVAIRAAVAGVVALSVRVDKGAFLVDIEKVTDWQPAEIAAVQTAIDGVPVGTPQLTARAFVATWSIERRAQWLVLIDQLNIIRADLTSLGINRPPITPAQAIAALNAKIDTLS